MTFVLVGGDRSGVIAKGVRIEAANVIWCAGVEASPVGQWLTVPTASGGRVEVAPDLSVPGHPEVFVIGDAALVIGPDGRPLSGLASVAKQQGRYVGKLLARLASGHPAPPPFRYHDEGTLATIGRHSAIADMRWIRLTGWPAWILWGIVHIFFLIGFRNRVAVFFNWVWAWLTYGRGARLITGETSILIFDARRLPSPAAAGAATQTAETDQRQAQQNTSL